MDHESDQPEFLARLCRSEYRPAPAYHLTTMAIWLAFLLFGLWQICKLMR